MPELTVMIMDAGQGDATLITYPDGSLVLVDCGCMKNSKQVATTIEPYLTSQLAKTSNTLKALVLTHPDKDHYSFVRKLIIDKNVTVQTLIHGGDANKYKVNNTKRWINAMNTAGRVWAMGADYFNTAPIPALSFAGAAGSPAVEGRILAANVGNDPNTNSVVILLTYYHVNIFLMGDATAETEDFIIEWDASDPQHPLSNLLGHPFAVTMLKAGHHGSDTSSSEDWIKKLAPNAVFISSDTKTFSGSSIPRKEIIDRIIQYGQLVDVYPNAPTNGTHYYVEYEGGTVDEHQQVQTTKALCTTLHLLEFTSTNRRFFTSYGTGWAYEVVLTPTHRDIHVNPSCTWPNINIAT